VDDFLVKGSRKEDERAYNHNQRKYPNLKKRAGYGMKNDYQ
jgi:hypothetical protein